MVRAYRGGYGYRTTDNQTAYYVIDQDGSERNCSFTEWENARGDFTELNLPPLIRNQLPHSNEQEWTIARLRAENAVLNAELAQLRANNNNH